MLNVRVVAHVFIPSIGLDWVVYLPMTRASNAGLRVLKIQVQLVFRFKGRLVLGNCSTSKLHQGHRRPKQRQNCGTPPRACACSACARETSGASRKLSPCLGIIVQRTYRIFGAYIPRVISSSESAKPREAEMITLAFARS